MELQTALQRDAQTYNEVGTIKQTNQPTKHTHENPKTKQTPPPKKQTKRNQREQNHNKTQTKPQTAKQPKVVLELWNQTLVFYKHDKLRGLCYGKDDVSE